MLARNSTIGGTLALVICVFLTQSAAGQTIYVDDNAGGLNNGSSWTDAYYSLQHALSMASYGDEIRVAQGIYRPDEYMGSPNGTGDRAATFQLRNGVALYGGHAGFGEPNPYTRDPNIYVSILSGDLNNNDGPNFYNNDENSYHVVKGSGTNYTAVLDGFTITAGNLDITGKSGAGMFNYQGSPTVRNCTFSRNFTSYYFMGTTMGDGAGMGNNQSSPTLTNCSFSGNSAARWGGGMFNYQSNPTLNNCTFTGNSAGEQGGGMENLEVSPTLNNCTFTGNSANYYGGGMDSYKGNPILTNCTFTANRASIGGGMIYSKIHMTNCTFIANSASSGGGIYSFYMGPGIPLSSTSTLTNCVFWGNIAYRGPHIGLASLDDDKTLLISYCNIQGGESTIYNAGSRYVWGDGNINEDPLLTPDGHIQAASPCIDAGTLAGAPGYDFDGEARPQGATVDIGVDEFIDTDGDGLPDLWESKYFGSAIAADPNTDSDGDGLTNLQEYELYGGNPIVPPYHVPSQFPTIQAGIDAAGDGDTVLVAPGTYFGPGNFELDYDGKSVIVLAPDGATIDCYSAGRAINFESTEGIFAVLEGFTITGGSTDLGGGIRTSRTRFMFKDCVLTGNSATSKGGGIYSYNSSLTFNSLTIQDNTAAPYEPNAGLIEFSNINLLGDLTVEAGRLDVISSWFDGPGCINLDQGTLVKVAGTTVIRTDVNGLGDIEIEAGKQLIIEGDAVVNLSGSIGCNPDGSSGGVITVYGALVVRDNATVENTNVDVKLLSFEGDNDIAHNNITLVETTTGFGGEFFTSGSSIISCNTIVSEGDRYLDLDPDPKSPERPIITHNQITVIIKEGTSGNQGTLLELRARDYDCGGSSNPDCNSGAYQVPSDSPGFTEDPSENWVLEQLILKPNAKLNLTNRQGFEFQDLSDPNLLTDWETVYVKELVLSPNSVLNTGLQTLYYQSLVDSNGAELFRDTNDPYAPLANGSRFQDIPVLGFSLAIIAMDDPTPAPHNEFDIRVRRRLNDPADLNHPLASALYKGSIQRIDDPTGAGGVMDMRTQASIFSASSVAAKGAFARAGDEEITIEFEYMFVQDPFGEAEIIVYLSDEPEVSQNLREVARIKPPALGRPGSIGSGKFALFSSTFSRGELNFVRGTYVELELRGNNTRCWIDKWDPRIYCSSTKCGDYGWLPGVVNVFDYLMLLAEFGLSSPGSIGKGCLDLVSDGVINNDDLLVWDTSSRLNMCPWVSSASMSDATVESEAWPSIPELEIQYASEPAPLLILGKPTISEMSTPGNYLYPVDRDGICQGDAIEPACPTPPCEENSGRFVADSKGTIYQVNADLGIIRQDGTVVVEPNVIGYGNSSVSIGLHNGEGLLLTDAAFQPDDPNIVYVVPVQVRPPASEGCPYMAAARLELTGAGKYNLLNIYGRNPIEYSTQLPTDCSNVGDFVYEPDLQHLHEIEVDSDGTVYVLSTQWTNKNNWLLIYYEEIPLSLFKASEPNPADGKVSVSRTADLSWTAGYGATSHDVYFGTTNPPPFMQNQTSTTFDPGTMAYTTTYYWRIDELNQGGKTTGTVWSFKTAGPGPSSLPFPPPPVGLAAAFQLNNHVTTESDSEVRVWLNNPDLIDPNLITGPSAMVISSVEEKVYLASSATTPMDSNDLTTEVYCFSINKDPYTQTPNFTFENIVEVNCPEPSTNICTKTEWCETNRCVSVITSMAEDPESGTLYVTGFTAPKFKEDAEWSPVNAPDFFSNPEFFTTPMFAVVPPDVNTVEAIEITNYDLSLPLVLPLSIVWTGLNNCSVVDVDNSGNVNFLDFATLASYWLEPDCIHLNWCSGADVNRNNVVDWKDLAILVRYWLESGCEN
ncbi:MAG: dockerin type I domain-containing protein [Planctomycetota bacterium]